jgi:hypothetical protein
MRKASESTPRFVPSFTGCDPTDPDCCDETCCGDGESDCC